MAARNYDEFPSYDMWLEENLDATIEEQREAKAHYKKQKHVAKTFGEILKFNPYHDSLGRFTSSGSAASFTYKPGASTEHSKAIEREKEKAGAGKAFKGTLYHGSPATDIKEFDMSRAGKNTSSGEKLLFFTDSKQMADDFSYERLEGSSKFIQRRGKKGRVYEVDVEMKNPLDFRNLSDKDIDNILRLDTEGLLTKDIVRSYGNSNHQLLKAPLTLTADKLKELGYDGFIANTGKAGHNSLEYAVVDSKQAKIIKSAAQSFAEILKFNPYHDSRGRFTTAGGATSFTYRPGQGAQYDNAIAREKERQGAAGKTTEDDTPRMKTIHGIEDKIRSQFYESAAVVDKDGNVVFMKSGGENMVGFSQMECFMMRNNTLTHNHPRSSMFSTEDIVCFTKNSMEEIRATTREGTTYSIKRGKDFTQDRAWQFVSQYDGECKIARRVAQQELDKRGFRGKIMDGEITHEYANREFSKVVTREMTAYCNKFASKYGIDFSVEKREVGKDGYNLEVYSTKSAGEEDQMILDQKTNDLDDAAFNEWLNKTEKSAGNERDYSILKTDDDKRLVFGWASVSITVDGEQVEDVQQDMIDPEDLEEAAYEYVLEFRDTGEEHIPTMRMKGKLVESCVFTAEKQKAIGIPEGCVPIGWWVGFKITDDSAWKLIKNGTYRMFSIEGTASREPVGKSARAKTFAEILAITE